MATTEPRSRTEWRVVCSQRPALNRLFKSGPAAAKYASGLEAQGLLGVRTNEHQITVWVARVRRVGAPDISKTFGRQADAEAWGREREGEIAKRQFVDYRAADGTSLGALFQKYDETRLAARDKNDPDRARIRKMLRHRVMQTRMSALTSGQIAGYRDERMQTVVKEVHGQEFKVKGATVKKELELMSRVIAIARREWGIHLQENPASGKFVDRPKPEPGDERDRRLREVHSSTPQPLEPAHKRKSKVAHASALACDGPRLEKEAGWAVAPWVVAWMQMPQSEEQLLLRALRYPHWFQPRKSNVTASTERDRAWRDGQRPPVKARDRRGGRNWVATSFATETALRRGELLKLRWEYVDLDVGCLDLPGAITKNGRPRLVPLSVRALRILRVQPRSGQDTRVFPFSASQLKQSFKRARARASARDYRFHDLRHEATSRLFENTSLRESEIGGMTGHTDSRMLQRYYNKRREKFVEQYKRSILPTPRAVVTPSPPAPTRLVERKNEPPKLRLVSNAAALPLQPMLSSPPRAALPPQAAAHRAVGTVPDSTQVRGSPRTIGLLIREAAAIGVPLPVRSRTAKFAPQASERDQTDAPSSPPSATEEPVPE